MPKLNTLRLELEYFIRHVTELRKRNVMTLTKEEKDEILKDFLEEKGLK